MCPRGPARARASEAGPGCGVSPPESTVAPAQRRQGHPTSLRARAPPRPESSTHRPAGRNHALGAIVVGIPWACASASLEPLRRWRRSSARRFLATATSWSSAPSLQLAAARSRRTPRRTQSSGSISFSRSTTRARWPTSRRSSPAASELRNGASYYIKNASLRQSRRRWRAGRSGSQRPTRASGGRGSSRALRRARRPGPSRGSSR